MLKYNPKLKTLMHIFASRFILFFLIIFLSCSINKKIGLKKLKYRTDNKINSYSNKFKIPNDLVLNLQDLKFEKEIELIKSVDTNFLKHLYQPIQIKIYQRGNFIYHAYSCNISSKEYNIDWKSTSFFNKYPPIPLDINLKKYYKPTYNYSLPDELNFNNENDKYTIIIFWSIYGGRQSENLINTTEKYRKKNSQKNLDIYYVNIDNFLYLHRHH